MKLSIVATLYKSAAHIAEFHQRASAAARQMAGDSHEIVFVNDGSPDSSLHLAVALADADPHVVVVDLSRNFGHHKAMMTGLAHARGAHIFLIDSDLEEEPEWLPEFAAQLQASACDVVYGVQASRKGGWFERWSGQLFYAVMPRITGLDMPQNMVTARLMSRRYVQALLRHDERELDIGGLWAITGFLQTPRTVRKHHTSQTTYTLRHRFAVLVNSVTSFSNAPLIAIFYIGMAMSLVAIAVASYVLVQWAFLSQHVSGWTSLIISVWLLGAMIILFMGVIGIYLSKIFSEVKRRPYTIVRGVHGRLPLAKPGDLP